MTYYIITLDYGDVFGTYLVSGWTKLQADKQVAIFLSAEDYIGDADIAETTEQEFMLFYSRGINLVFYPENMIENFKWMIYKIPN